MGNANIRVVDRTRSQSANISNQVEHLPLANMPW